VCSCSVNRSNKYNRCRCGYIKCRYSYTRYSYVDETLIGNDVAIISSAVCYNFRYLLEEAESSSVDEWLEWEATTLSVSGYTLLMRYVLTSMFTT